MSSFEKMGSRIWRGVQGLTLALGLLTLAPSGVHAHVSPDGCNANLLNLGNSRIPTGGVVNGQQITYTVSVTNPGGGSGVACDVTDAEVTFTCPGTDGTASGTVTTLSGAGGDDFPADGTGDVVYPPVVCTVNVTDPGVTSVTGKAQIGFNDITKGRLHDSVNDDAFDRENAQSNEFFTCSVQVDKQVSCDGGVTWVDPGLVSANDDGTLSCDGINGQPIQVRYQAMNTGTTDVFSCTLGETNVEIGGGPGSIGNIAAGQTTSFSTDTDQNCSDTLEAGEPDSALLSCFCTAALDENLKAGASDSASFTCNTPGLTVSKLCEPQEAGTNQVEITVTNTGDADLTNCIVTDSVFADDPTCPGDVGTGTAVTVTPTPFDLASGSAAQVVTGDVTGLTADACNTVSVVCNVNGTSATVNGSATDVCETAGEGCLTRTAGFWKNKPQVTNEFLPVESCGLTIDSFGEVAQDLCVSGAEAKAASTSMAQLQLIRQCTAAALNIAATNEGGGSCESEVSGINQTIADCCNDADSVCRSGLSGAEIGASSCISALDAFNTLGDTRDQFGPFQNSGAAQPSQCKAAGKDKQVNPGRTLGSK